MSDDWKPRLVRRAIVGGKGPELQALPASAAIVPAGHAIVKQDAPPPKAWRFVPRRDDQNLIVEIIATPMP